MMDKLLSILNAVVELLFLPSHVEHDRQERARALKQGEPWGVVTGFSAVLLLFAFPFIAAEGSSWLPRLLILSVVAGGLHAFIWGLRHARRRKLACWTSMGLGLLALVMGLAFAVGTGPLLPST